MILGASINPLMKKLVPQSLLKTLKLISAATVQAPAVDLDWWKTA